MSAVVSRIDQAGRISVSAQQRRALGLKSGSPIVISVVGNELRIRSMHAAMAELQNEAGQFLQSEIASVDAFIAQRHADGDGEQEIALVSSNPEPTARPDIEFRPDLEFGPDSASEPDLELEPEPKVGPDPDPEPKQHSKPKPRSKR